MEIALGTENQTVIFLRSRNSGSATNACTGVDSRVAPAPHAMNMSNMARSKVAAKVWEQTSSGVKPYRCWLKRRNWSTLPWLIGTPFGRPVEPDVNSTYAMSPGRAADGSVRARPGWLRMVVAGGPVASVSGTSTGRVPARPVWQRIPAPRPSATNASTDAAVAMAAVRSAGNVGLSGTAGPRRRTVRRELRCSTQVSERPRTPTAPSRSDDGGLERAAQDRAISWTWV